MLNLGPKHEEDILHFVSRNDVLVTLLTGSGIPCTIVGYPASSTKYDGYRA